LFHVRMKITSMPVIKRYRTAGGAFYIDWVMKKINPRFNIGQQV
jgi:hypothetical protein